MRVLVVTVVHVPLDARILHRQIAALRAGGHDVTYAAPWSATGSVPPPGITALDLPRAAGRRRAAAAAAARRLVRREAPAHDLVLLHDPELLPALAGLRLPVPVVWDVHEDTGAAVIDKPWLPRPLRVPAAAAVRSVERLVERRMPLLLAEEGYRDRFARPHPVVPNAPSVPPQVPPTTRGRAVYVGRVARSRGALELVALSRRVHATVRVEVFGPADADVAPLLRRAADDGVLVWHGFVPNDRALPAVAGATVGLSLVADQPNHRVSLQTKVLEYLAWGVPVVTTPLPWAARFVQRAGAGVVVPFGDADAAAEAVLALDADDARRQAMADAGRAAVEREYDWRAHGPRFVAQLEEWAAQSR